MIKVAKFQLYHIGGFIPRDGYENLERDMRLNLADPSRDLVSILRNEEVIAIVGLNNLRPGVGEVWLICSVLVEQCHIEFFKAVKNLVDIFVMEMMGLHRVHLAVDCRLPHNIKWAERLGFTLEGTMRKYDVEGNDHYLFAKVRE